MKANLAAFGETYFLDLCRITADLSELDGTGVWFVAAWFEGPILAFEFAATASTPPAFGTWFGVENWKSDFDRDGYIAAVEAARDQIALGNVYEVNICRQLSGEMINPYESDSLALYTRILQAHPATQAAYLRVSDARLTKFGLPENVEIVSASPELFLRRKGGEIESSPIKGTAPTAGEFLEKDVSENIMIVDLVRNDLSAVAEVASVRVPEFLKRQEIPGISHLVTTVAATLRADVGWQDIFSATFPPGSVTGAPKSSALQIISDIETPRNIYCGSLGYVDADQNLAELSVAIRTFWRSGDQWKFGTGAGITWGSEAAMEWEETELKASRLIAIASEEIHGEL